MIQRATRAQRGLPPYVSPRAAWDDDETLTPTFVVEVVKAPSSRTWRRQRRRDAAAMGRKSRKTAFRQEVKQFHAEQNLRGIARVWLLGAGTPGMLASVTDEVLRMSKALAKEKGISTAEALDEIETMLRQVLEAYQDDVHQLEEDVA